MTLKMDTVLISVKMEMLAVGLCIMVYIFTGLGVVTYLEHFMRPPVT